MTTFKAFNSMLSDFFGDLADTFDEYKSISDAKLMLDGLVSMNDETDVPMKTFTAVFQPHSDLLMNKDGELFNACKIPMVSESGFDMAKEWETLEEDNKEAIWGYLQQLYLTGSTVLNLSGDLLSSIEDLARGCMEKVERKEMSAEDAQNPMVIFQEIMKNPALMDALSKSGMK